MLIEGRNLSQEEAATFANFIIQLKLRNPFWLENILEKKKDEWIDESISKIEKQLEENPQYSYIPEEIRASLIEEIRNQNKNNQAFSKKLQLYSIVMHYEQDIDSNGRVRESLLRCAWSLIKAPQNGPFFITSDNPGGAIGVDNLYHNTRFENGFQFFLPLSPFYCFGITDSVTENYHEGKIKKINLLEANQQLIISINHIEIQHVNKLIIARDKWYLDQIAELNKPHS